MSDEIVVCPRCGKKYRIRGGAAVSSFPCKECEAAVRVQPAEAPRKGGPGGRRRRSAAARAKSRPAGRGGGRRATRRAAAAGSRARPEGRGARHRAAGEPEEEGERPHRGRYAAQRKKSNQMMIAITGGLLVVVVVVAVVVMGGKKQQTAAPTGAGGDTVAQVPAGEAGGAGDTAPAGGTAAPAADPASGGVPEPADTGAGRLNPGAAVTEPKDLGDPDHPETKRDFSKRKKKLGKKKRWQADPNMPHLESTPPDERKKIDELVAVMCDPEAGIDSRLAREQLVAIGKAAFPRILGKMAQLRDQLSKDENLAGDALIRQNLILSSVVQCDRALREMDGYLSSKNVQEIKIGHTREYVRYVSGQHLKRWEKVLKERAKMPGPYEAEYEEEEE
ncbi:MAG: hypothetical protein ACE5JG_10990 [Planctomycetota bacterium]